MVPFSFAGETFVASPEGALHWPARNALLVDTEVVALMDDEAIELEKGAGVEKNLEALAGRLLAGLVLPLDSLLAATELGLAIAPAQLFQPVVHRHGVIVDGVVTKVNGFIDFHVDLPQ